MGSDVEQDWQMGAQPRDLKQLSEIMIVKLDESIFRFVDRIAAKEFGRGSRFLVVDVNDLKSGQDVEQSLWKQRAVFYGATLPPDVLRRSYERGCIMLGAKSGE